MAIISNEKADAFVARPPAKIDLFLVHGNEEGLIHDRAKQLVEALSSSEADPLALIRHDGEALIRDPGRLLDDACSISMFGGRRTIWIDAKGRDLTKVLAPLFEKPLQDCAIVVEAGNLKKGAPLLSLFEGPARAASIECNPDEKKALRKLIGTEAQAVGLGVSEDALELLTTLLASDRMMARGEVSKLVMYALGQQTIEVEDVEAIVAGAQPSDVDKLLNAAFGGALPQTEALWSRFVAQAGDVGEVVGKSLPRAAFLLRMIALRGSGGSDLWTWNKLSARAPALLEMAARTRRVPRLAPEVTIRALWTLARAARARG